MLLKKTAIIVTLHALLGMLPSQAITEFSTDFDSLTTGAVTNADLDAVSTGGTWFFKADRGASHEAQDSGGDKAVLMDDPDASGNDGNLLFAGVTLDNSVDLTQKQLTWNFRVATRRTGNDKGLRFTIVDTATNQPAVQLDWYHNSNTVSLNNGEDSDTSSFAFLNPWDTGSSNVKDVTISIVGNGVTVDFDGVKLFGNVLNASTSIGNLRVWSIDSAVGARGVFLDDMTLETDTLTGVPTFQDFHYRGLTPSDPDYDHDLIRVYSPPTGTVGVDSRPAILMFHGGGWSSGSITQFDYFCSEMAKLGYVAATADYRFSNNSAAAAYDDPKELCVNDARLATAWLESQASALGFKDGELLIGGGSAGGHLATMVALQPDELAAAAQGPLSISAMLLFNAAYHESEISGANSLRVDPERQLAELVANAKLPPPAIHLFGNYDHWRMPDDFLNASNEIQNGIGRALPFIDACRDAGAEAELWYAIGKGHSFFNATDWMERCIVEIDYFLIARGINGATLAPASFAHPELQLELATSLHAWRLNWFQNESSTGDATEDQNPDSDDYNNFTEFGLGTNPLIADLTPPLIIDSESSELRFTRRQQTYAFANPVVVVELETSTTLATNSWTPVEIDPEDITGTVDDIESIAMTYVPNPGTNRFYRLNVRSYP
ncbi:MAG: alpha/beta hydrolase [Opitutaceae bacterium]